MLNVGHHPDARSRRKKLLSSRVFTTEGNDVAREDREDERDKSKVHI